MAFLYKRGKTYYIRYHWRHNGSESTVTRALETRYKDIAKERLEEQGKINPYGKNFNPLEILKKDESKKYEIHTVQDALKKFLESKKHLSEKTVEAYEWAIKHFIDENEIEFYHPSELHINHFENIIFKEGISIETRHYYFRHFRAWWNWLMDIDIVDFNFFDEIKKAT